MNKIKQINKNYMQKCSVCGNIQDMKVNYNFKKDKEAFSFMSEYLFDNFYGQYAVMHNGEFIKNFKTVKQADDFGIKEYGDGFFSLLLIKTSSIIPAHYYTPGLVSN